MFLPLQGGGQEGDGVSVGVVLNLPKRKINSTIRISARAGFPFLDNGKKGITFLLR
jgi:hypothetical protein